MSKAKGGQRKHLRTDKHSFSKTSAPLPMRYNIHLEWGNRLQYVAQMMNPASCLSCSSEHQSTETVLPYFLAGHSSLVVSRCGTLLWRSWKSWSTLLGSCQGWNDNANCTSFGQMSSQSAWAPKYISLTEPDQLMIQEFMKPARKPINDVLDSSVESRTLRLQSVSGERRVVAAVKCLGAVFGSRMCGVVLSTMIL